MKLSINGRLLALSAVTTIFAAHSFAATVYVRTTGNDSSSGFSWANAKKTIQAGINTANSGDQVWVASGRYVETITTKEGVKLYAGFNGAETSLPQRNFKNNPTVLDSNYTTNAVNVPLGQTSATLISGFIIRYGNGYQGGGLYESGSSITIDSNTFMGCVSFNSGGGVFIQNSNSLMIGNVIESCSSGSSGGLYVTGGAPVVINNTIIDCNGGGVIWYYSGGTFANNIVTSNDFGVQFAGTPATFHHNCVFGNPYYNYLGISASGSDITANPNLASSLSGNIHLIPGSPCINTGDSTVIPAGAIDIDDQARIQGASVDIGADESDGTTPTVSTMVMYVSPSGLDTNSGMSWGTALKTIQAAINSAQIVGATEIWVKGGTYSEKITLKPFVQIYGGFAGSETLRSQRSWKTNVTIIDGAKSGVVVTANGETGFGNSVIDGFTIRNGSGYNGGGFTFNYGAPVVYNNVITGNYASDVGGGIYATYSSFIAANNVFSGNSSVGTGAGIYTSNYSPFIINNTFAGNNGGAINVYYAAAFIKNNIITTNDTGITFNGNTVVTLSHNDVYNNFGYNYFGVVPTTDIQTDPKVVSFPNGNFHILPTSPDVNSGDNTAFANLPSLNTDYEAQARVQGGTIDIGADESDGSTPTSTSAVLRVSTTGSDSNDGLTWATAKKTIQAAMDAMNNSNLIGEVWVKTGTYQEHIILRPYVRLYGGFAGTETVRAQRSWTVYPTILDGTFNGSVVSSAYDTGYQIDVVDGFTIMNGYAYTGGGIYLADVGIIIQNNTITGNYGSNVGGGIYGYRSSMLAANNVLSGNSSNGNGSAIYVEGFYSNILNNTITSNNGAAVYSYYSYASITNNIVAFNDGGILHAGNTTLTLSHNDVFGNSTFNYSGVAPGTADFSADPQFAGRVYGNIHLLNTSPCKNVGDNNAIIVLGAGPTDIDGEARIQGGTIDVGADENNGTTPVVTFSIIRVSPSGNDSNNGSTWTLAKKTIQAGINAAYSSGTGEVWVKAGTYVERITLKPYVQVYGGFAGAEVARSARNWHTNVSIIDGSQVGTVVSTLTDGGYLISALDGFTVRNGYAYSGGGINITASSPYIVNDTIIQNYAGNVGGGICATGSSFVCFNCVISSNSAINGGGIYCQNFSPVIVNNTVTNNQGGGIYSYYSTANISNNIVYLNDTGILMGGLTVTLSHNDVFKNTGFNYSGQPASGTDLSVDPLLADVYINNVHLNPTSPVINMGDNSAVALIGTGLTDYDNQSRIQSGTVDIGADESDGSTPVVTVPIIRVATTGNDSNNGSSWALAKKTIQAGLDALLQSGGEVWVKSGIYNERIIMHPFVQLYGGFAGAETLKSQRNFGTNVTVIDGGAGGSVVTSGIDSGFLTNTIDGFTIRNGSSYNGGGISMSGSASYVLNNIIDSNYAANQGGGIFGYRSSYVCVNNFVQGNKTNGASNSASGIYCENGYPYFVNNTVTGNLTDGVYAYYSNLTMSNTIMAFNGTGLHTNGFNVTLDHNDVYGNATANYNGQAAGLTDISVDPQFVNISDPHLLVGSLCINAGNNTPINAISVVSTDIDYQARIQGGTVDIGADENNGTNGQFITFTGTVKLQGYVGTALPISQLPVYIDAFGTTYSTIKLTGSGNTGTFTIRIPKNTAGSIKIKPGGFLAQRIAVPASASNVAQNFFGPGGVGLVPGDLNNDNFIDDTDLLIVINNFLNGPPINTFDANGNGFLDDTDLLAVINNFLAVGDN